MGIVVIAMFTAATLPFELMPWSLIWLGWILTMLAFGACYTLFYFIWAFRNPEALRRLHWKVVAGPYRCGKRTEAHETDGDMTVDVLILIIVYTFPTWLAFGISFILTNSYWWQFYTALIIAGVYMLIFFILRFTAFRLPALKKHRAVKRPDCPSAPDACGMRPLVAQQ